MTTPDDIRQVIAIYLERVDLDVSESISLEDIAPVEQWEALILNASDSEAAEAFLRSTVAILERRYPYALPFPFCRLLAVGVHEEWWPADPDSGRTLALEAFDAYIRGDPGAARLRYAATSNRTAALRGLLEISAATLCVAQGHPKAPHRTEKRPQTHD